MTRFAGKGSRNSIQSVIVIVITISMAIATIRFSLGVSSLSDRCVHACTSYAPEGQRLLQSAIDWTRN